MPSSKCQDEARPVQHLGGLHDLHRPLMTSTPPSSTSHSQWLPKIESVCRRSFEPVVSELMADLRIRRTFCNQRYTMPSLRQSPAPAFRRTVDIVRAMPFEMLFDRDHKVLLVRFGRALTRQALESMVQAARAFVGVRGNCDGIVDFSAVEKIDSDVAYLTAAAGA
jgi:hypothetical protein